MEMLTLTVAALALGGCGLILAWSLRTFNRFEHEVGRQTQVIQSELLKISTQMNEQLTSNSSVVQGYTRLMGEFQNRLGQLQESTHSMIRIGQDISSLQDILKAPKLRGILGETFLEEILRQLLPQDRYHLQFGFRSGEKVDAVILLGQGMVPVDAKFPLESFKRSLQEESSEAAKKGRRQFYQAVKRHIDSIASKYILPEEGTFDFALMYLPAENVYYETILKDEDAGEGQSLSQYALTKKVIPVSPNSFYAYLQAIVLGLRGLRIENSAREILASLAQLANDFRKFYDDFEIMGSHLTNAKGAHEKAQKRLDRLQQQLDAVETQREPAPVLPGDPSS